MQKLETFVNERCSFYWRLMDVVNPDHGFSSKYCKDKGIWNVDRLNITIGENLWQILRTLECKKYGDSFKQAGDVWDLQSLKRQIDMEALQMSTSQDN
eukprot:TRINITY_DN13386_c0_g1_i1.p1 TRINITY_DN13386_c0_g1~~TRINITY_DN13386_c0_g1_i1.p1  ORF type:complete len:98 (-),score=16.45 TRINITY_DN13386_c0_g1_i1:82-375(-)